MKQRNGLMGLFEERLAEGLAKEGGLLGEEPDRRFEGDALRTDIDCRNVVGEIWWYGPGF